MHQSFRNGFEKSAAIDGTDILAAGGLLAGLAGLGAMVGHEAHVGKKIVNARQGKEYKPESFIERNPKLTGALSLGLAPAISLAVTQADIDRENPMVRRVVKEHPLVGPMLTGI